MGIKFKIFKKYAVCHMYHNQRHRSVKCRREISLEINENDESEENYNQFNNNMSKEIQTMKPKEIRNRRIYFCSNV